MIPQKTQIDSARAVAGQLLLEAKSLVPGARPEASILQRSDPGSLQGMIPVSIPTYFVVAVALVIGVVVVGVALGRRRK